MSEQSFEEWMQGNFPVRRKRHPSVREVLKAAMTRGIDPRTLDCPVRPEHKLSPMLDSSGWTKCRTCDVERVRRRRAKGKVQ